MEAPRPPGQDELFFIIRNALKYYSSVGMTLSVEISNLPQESFIRVMHNAIKSAITKHPILLVSPEDELEETVRFSPLRRVQLTQVLHVQSRFVHGVGEGKDEQLDAELQRQHNVGFEKGKPQWRILVVRDQSAAHGTVRCIISFIYHHALGDGLSGIAFLSCLIKELSTPDFSPSPDTIEIDFLPLLPTAEMLRMSAHQIGNSNIAGANAIKQVPAKNVQPETSESSGKLWLGTIHTNQYPISSRFMSFDIKSTQVQRLRKLCSANQTSITPLLQVIVAKSIFVVLSDEYDQLRGLCSISLRPNLHGQIPNDAVGNYVAGFATKYTRSAFEDQQYTKADQRHRSFWDEVKRTRESMLAAVSHERENFQRPSSTNTRSPQEIAQWMQQLIGKPRVASFDLNNLGLSHIGQGINDSLRSDRLVFSASQSVIGSALKVNAVTNLQGQMTIGLMWQDGAVEDGDIAGFAKNIQQIVNDLVID